MKAQLLFVLLIGLTLGSNSANAMEFRGLNSSSTMSDVAEVFPSAIEEREFGCTAEQELTRSAEGETRCTTLLVRHYEVDNIDFELRFQFNPDGTLRYVSMIETFGIISNEPSYVSASFLRSTFASISDLYLGRYGRSVEGPVISVRRDMLSGIDNFFEWQPDNGTTWQAGVDRISLSLNGFESRVRPGYFYASIQVFYTFAKRGQFDRI